MKKMMKNDVKNKNHVRVGLMFNRGITLITLVITILILIILVGVAINISIGNNGIFRRAKEEKNLYTNSQRIEK